VRLIICNDHPLGCVFHGSLGLGSLLAGPFGPARGLRKVPSSQSRDKGKSGSERRPRTH
jgi:hypothetical protein